MTTTMNTAKQAATRVQVDSKSLYAKLLATENLSVEHDPKAPTAYFDTKNRRLVLPKWENMSDDLYNMLVAHEVAHALFTPAGDGWVADVSAIDPKNAGTVKGYFNVVEDARIERLVKQRYPGVRRSFLAAYNELHQTDKFQIANKDVSEMSLIDRINLHYKIGVFINVPFSAEELPLVSEVATTKTYADVLDLTRRIYEFAKEQKRQEEQEQTEDGKGKNSDQSQSGESQESQEGEGGDSEGGGSSEAQEGQETNQDRPTGDSGDGEGGSPTDAKEGSGDDSGGLEQGVNGRQGATESVSDVAPDKALTDEVLENASKQYANQYGKKNAYGDLPDFDLSAIVSPAEISKLMQAHASWKPSEANEAYNQFVRENQNAINMLYREFMQRRAADEHRRTRTAETGSIDANRLWAYRISEEVFATYQSVRDGQNHGLIFYVDWSGSMGGIIRKVVEQTLCLTEFCRKANIPFEVYAFTDRPFATDHDHAVNTGNMIQVFQNPWKKSGNSPMLGTNFRLLNFLSSRLKGNEYRNSAALLLWLAKDGCYKGPECFRLNGTPLNAAVASAFTLLPMFKKANRLQIVHTIFLTDGGAGDSFHYANPNNYCDYTQNLIFRRDGYQAEPCQNYAPCCTSALLNLLRTVCTGTNTIGFDLLGVKTIANRIGRESNKSQTDLIKQVKDDGFGTLDNYCGYSRWFGLHLSTEDTVDHWESLRTNGKKVTSSVLSKTLSRELSKAKGNRQFLTRFAEIIAKEAK